ncbi:hypothetical protein, partial [Neisseria meningitidis]|uniref:hypothetical protein n=1 Tax=Neisseria meningitidis TaxID=487 RepID=UPI001C593FE0
LNMGNGFVTVCRFNQGAAVEGADVGFLKNLVLNILFHSSKCRLKSKYRFRRHFDCRVLLFFVVIIKSHV